MPNAECRMPNAECLMPKLISFALVASFFLQSDPQALPRMVATERAFAAATAEIGVRDGFLTFFADDSVTIRAGSNGATATVVPARVGLMAAPLPPLPLVTTLIWEPFTGQVSSDGSLGWLTGGYARMTAATKDVVGQGAYFSVWKRQANGTWRVWLDEGIALPQIWRDAAPFRAALEPDAGQAGAANESIDAVEREVATGGDNWRARLAQTVRLHRDGRMPLVGRDAVQAWAEETWKSVRYTVVKTEAAGSGDLAVTIGGYDATTAAGAEHGTWVRVWKRDVTGRWRLMFETSKKAA
jgi:ketosteroid isomerase-like protein